MNVYIVEGSCYISACLDKNMEVLYVHFFVRVLWFIRLVRDGKGFIFPFGVAFAFSAVVDESIWQISINVLSCVSGVLVGRVMRVVKCASSGFHKNDNCWGVL